MCALMLTEKYQWLFVNMTGKMVKLKPVPLLSFMFAALCFTLT